LISRVVWVALLSAWTHGCVSDPAPERVISDGRYAMGTVLEIAIEGLEPQPAARALDELYAEALRRARSVESIARPVTGTNESIPKSSRS